jgi:hypothetical protein
MELSRAEQITGLDKCDPWYETCRLQMQVPLVMCLHVDVRLDSTLGMYRGNDGDPPNGFVCTNVDVDLYV